LIYQNKIKGNKKFVNASTKNYDQIYHFLENLYSIHITYTCAFEHRVRIVKVIIAESKAASVYRGRHINERETVEPMRRKRVIRVLNLHNYWYCAIAYIFYETAKLSINKIIDAF